MRSAHFLMIVSEVLDHQSKMINVMFLQLKNFLIVSEVNWRHFDHQLSLISFELGPLVDFNGEHNLNLSFFFAFKSSCFPRIFDIILTNLTIILILFSYSWYYGPFYDFIKWSYHDFLKFKKPILQYDPNFRPYSQRFDQARWRLKLIECH